MLVSMTELMKDASEKGYAVGAFNAVNFESLRAIIAAAEDREEIAQCAEQQCSVGHVA